MELNLDLDESSSHNEASFHIRNITLGIIPKILKMLLLFMSWPVDGINISQQHLTYLQNN